MDAEKYNRRISLLCPTCGGSQFEFDGEVAEDQRIYKCAGCDRELTKEELMRENGENIAAHHKEMGEEIIKDFAKEMRENLKKAFRGSKNIKIR